MHVVGLIFTHHGTFFLRKKTLVITGQDALGVIDDKKTGRKTFSIKHTYPVGN